MQRTHQLSHMREYRCVNRCCADSINIMKLLVSLYNRFDVSNLFDLNFWRDSARTVCKSWILSFLHALLFKHRSFLRYAFICSATKISESVCLYVVALTWKNTVIVIFASIMQTWKIIVIVIFASEILLLDSYPICVKNLKIIFVNDSRKAWFDDFIVCCFQYRKPDFVQFTTLDLMT